MNPTPSPIPVTVVAPPPEWWQIVAALSPFAVLVGAIVAGIIGFNQIKQKREADNRAEWWKRTQWALDAVYSGDDRRGTVGLKVLTVLAESDLAGRGELDVLEAAWENPLDEVEQELTAEAGDEPAEPQDQAAAERPRPAMLFPHLDEEATTIILLGDGRGNAAGVDDEPEPRDNEEDDEPQPTGGGPR